MLCCAGYTDVQCKNDGADRDAVWGLTHVCPKNHILDGVKIPMGWGNFGGSWSSEKH